MGRAGVAITLSEAERCELDGLARCRKKRAQGLARRARIALASADGLEIQHRAGRCCADLRLRGRTTLCRPAVRRSPRRPVAMAQPVCPEA